MRESDNIYNSIDLIMDKELTKLSYNIKINTEFKINDIQTSDLWKVETINDNLIKAVPLFNCDEIISNNSDDIIIEENKCAILKIDSDTIVKCQSNDRPDIHFDHMVIEAWIPYTDSNHVIPRTVYAILTDTYMIPMVNAEIEVLVNGELDSVLITDNNGMVEYEFTEWNSSLQFRYNIDRQYYII